MARKKKIDDDMSDWIHSYMYWTNKILDALKGTLLEDMLVRVVVKEGKKRKTVKVMTATVNKTQLKKDVQQSRDLVTGIVFYLKYFLQYF